MQHGLLEAIAAQLLAFMAVLLPAFVIAADPPTTAPATTAPPPTTAPVGKMPHLAVDVKKKEIRVDCEAVKADYPLEFLAVVSNTNEYEALIRSEVRPSNLHLALLMLGLKPGEPIHYSDATQTWRPPTGPPVDIWFEYQKDGRAMKVPAYRWMRDVKTKKEAPPMYWVFTGSRVLEDNSYGADGTGSLIGVINNDLTILDVPQLKGRALESREWERNPDLMPATGTAVTMVLSPAAAGEDTTQPAATQPAIRVLTPPTTGPVADAAGLSDVHIDQDKVDRLKKHWDTLVLPHRDALREAAQAHYEAIADLRKEQQRLIDEADRIQRTIDDLEKQYQDMTTPQPAAR
jgi:hypothetical protein